MGGAAEKKTHTTEKTICLKYVVKKSNQVRKLKNKTATQRFLTFNLISVSPPLPIALRICNSLLPKVLQTCSTGFQKQADLFF